MSKAGIDRSKPAGGLVSPQRLLCEHSEKQPCSVVWLEIWL
jgi:hypothetical protein